MLQFLKNNNIEYKQNVSISQLTGMYQGGTIPFVVYPSTYDQIVLLYRYVNDNHLRFDILGSITNTYIASTYHCDVVIKTTKYNDFSIHNDTAYASCGCLLTKVAQKLSSFGCKGYEGLVGIPGTIGAAAINNSGAFDSSMDKVVRAVTIINANGLISKLSNEQLKYKTRHSILKGSNNSCMVLTVELDISRRGDVTSIQKIIQRNIRYRKVVIDGKRK
ncbi:MAG: FAD-binding protein, partial [Agathobacter sp.]